MFNTLSSKTQSVLLSLALISGFSLLTGCDSEPPALMKAVKQFESDEIRDQHVREMRKDHMDALIHKRDETMYKGIRTKKHSLKACINCHVPEEHNGKPLRHTDPEHFCSTCHGYVAAQLDCFQCHADRPSTAQSMSKAPDDAVHSTLSSPYGHETSPSTPESVTLSVENSTTAGERVIAQASIVDMETAKKSADVQSGSTGESKSE